MDPLTPDDIAEAVIWATNLLCRVNINTIELMPAAQAFAPLALVRAAS